MLHFKVETGGRNGINPRRPPRSLAARPAPAAAVPPGLLRPTLILPARLPPCDFLLASACADNPWLSTRCASTVFAVRVQRGKLFFRRKSASFFHTNRCPFLTTEGKPGRAATARDRSSVDVPTDHRSQTTDHGAARLRASPRAQGMLPQAAFDSPKTPRAHGQN